MTDLPPVTELVAAMARELETQIHQRGLTQPAMIGIHTGGVWIAERLHAALGLEDPLGTLDISFYRDDFSHVGITPQVRPSRLPFSVEGRHIMLVDDVFYTGRTIRGAMNEIFDYGRPASITLAALVDRGGHELPIAPDVVGIRLELVAGERIKLSGPDPLLLTRRGSA